MSLLLIFPLPLFWLLVFAGLLGHAAAGTARVREAGLAAAAITGLMLVFATELLSALGRFDRAGLLWFWGVADLGAAGLLVRQSRRGFRPLPLPAVTLSWFEWILVALVGVELAALATIAWVAPPNNWDSMSYHMTRVAHWIDHRSVYFFPTHDFRHLDMNPFAEWTIAHLQILSGGDRFATFVQWSALVGSLVAASLAVRHLGGTRREQVLAAVFVAAIPMGILQATSTQNDLAAAFWVMSFVCSFLGLRTGFTWFRAFCTGVCLGLAVLTKATAGLYVLPFGLWLAVWACRTEQRRRLPALAAIGLLCLVINAGHWTRNARVFGNPVGPGYETTGFRYKVDSWSPGGLASNLARNAALELASPNTAFNTWLQNTVINLHHRLGLDINDPRTTSTGLNFNVGSLVPHEDVSSNWLAFVFAVGAAPLWFCRKRLRTRRDLLLVGACVAGGAVLFCLVLRWQPWHCRLHLPLLVLSAPFVMLVWSGAVGRWFAATLALALLGTGSYWVLNNIPRPLVGKTTVFNQTRVDQYFANRTDLRAPYLEAARRLRRLTGAERQAGMLISTGLWEYPLWILTRNESGGGISFEHVNVQNVTAGLAAPHPLPAVIVDLLGNPATNLVVQGTAYTKEWGAPSIAIFRKLPAATTTAVHKDGSQESRSPP